MFLVFLLILWRVFFGGGTELPAQETGFKENEILIQATGKLVPLESANLGFSRAGIVAWAPKKVGEVVPRGALLAELNLSELRANLLEAEAMVVAETAKLEELNLGTRPEELAITETELKNAETALDHAEKNLQETLLNSYTKADDAVRNQADQLFIEPRSGNPDLVFSLLDQNSYVEPDFDSTDGILIEVERRQIEKDLMVWVGKLNTASVAEVTVNLSKIKGFLDRLALITNALVEVIGLTQATIDDYRGAVATARADINTAINNLFTATEELNNAEASLALVRRELSLDQAGSLPQVILAQVAKVNQAKAKVAIIEAQITGGRIVAPFAGTISRYDPKVGEAVAANIGLISLISAGELEIEANVPEVHIGELLVGDRALIEFDAFLDEEFFGHITSIEPAETLVDGVVNFKVKITLDAQDPRLKSGLTANIEIAK